MSRLLEKEFEFYLHHQNEFVEKHDGQYVVIADGHVVGVYDDALTAVTETQKSYKLGTFLVQKVSEGNAEYTQTFHSRVTVS